MQQYSGRRKAVVYILRLFRNMWPLLQHKFWQITAANEALKICARRPASTADADKDDDETEGETNERDGDNQQNYIHV